MQPAQPPDDTAATAASPDASAAASTRPARLKPGERRIHILQTLAAMLEQPKSEKITTAALAARIGVSEAALYRHFRSKAQMFEGLIDFIEQTFFGLINQITAKETNGVRQAHAISLMLLNFPAKNAGMTRVLTGEALVGEDPRLAARIEQMLERIEASVRQSLRLSVSDAREAVATDALVAPASSTQPGYDAALRASLLMSYVIGRWHRYVHSGFRRLPAEQADAQLGLILG